MRVYTITMIKNVFLCSYCLEYFVFLFTDSQTSCTEWYMKHDILLCWYHNTIDTYDVLYSRVAWCLLRQKSEKFICFLRLFFLFCCLISNNWNIRNLLFGKIVVSINISLISSNTQNATPPGKFPIIILMKYCRVL